MAGVRDFRKLAAWQRADELRILCEELLKDPRVQRDYKPRDQLSDASGSAPRNIAEGFGRKASSRRPLFRASRPLPAALSVPRQDICGSWTAKRNRRRPSLGNLNKVPRFQGSKVPRFVSPELRNLGTLEPGNPGTENFGTREPWNPGTLEPWNLRRVAASRSS